MEKESEKSLGGREKGSPHSQADPSVFREENRKEGTAKSRGRKDMATADGKVSDVLVPRTTWCEFWLLAVLIQRWLGVWVGCLADLRVIPFKINL